MNILDDMNKVLEQGSPVNVLALHKAISVIEFVTGLILGVIVWGLVVGSVLVFALDIAYLTIPFARNRISELNWDKVGGFRIVSKNAQLALENYYTTGESYLSYYLRKSVVTCTITAVMLIILVGGGWKAVMGIVSIFANSIAVWIYSL